MVVTNADRRLGQQVIDLIDSRIDEAAQLPGTAVRVIEDAVYPQHITENVMLCGDKDAVRLSRTSYNERFATFARGIPGPACTIKIIGLEAPRITFEGPDQDAPTLDDLTEKIRALPIGLNELVPYGWVEGNTVVALVYSNGITLDSATPGARVVHHAVSCYLLEGAGLPEGLVIDDVAHSYEWSARMWSHIQAGQLVQLSDRFQQLGEIRNRFDGVHQPYIEFELSDGQSPAIVAGRPYVATRMLASEKAVPYELATVNGGEPLDLELRGWFR